MNRFHVHAHVEDLQASVDFYSRLFAAEPTRREADYAKWMLDDPRINFAISTRGGRLGVDHLGFQTDTPEELGALRERAAAAELNLRHAGETSCCYARSEKHWIVDPQGIAWEQFHTLENIPVFGVSGKTAPERSVSGATGARAVQGASVASVSAGAAGSAACCASADGTSCGTTVAMPAAAVPAKAAAASCC